MGSPELSAYIEIGGPLPAQLVDKFCAAIAQTAWSYEEKRDVPCGPAVGDWDADPFTATTAAQLLELAQGSTLDLYDGQARNGEFADIEAFCQQHGIAYDRHTTEAYTEVPCIARFRPGMSTPDVTNTDTCGYETVRADGVRQALEIASSKDIPTSQRLKLVAEKLRATLGPDVPPLAPLSIVD